jgi:hypothetical protein
MILTKLTTAKILVDYGQIQSNLSASCDVGATTWTSIVQRKRTLLQHRNVATASWPKERQLILPNIGTVGMQKKKFQKEVRKTGNTMTGRMFPSKFTTSTISFAAALRGDSKNKKRMNLHQDPVAGLIGHDNSKNEQRQ